MITRCRSTSCRRSPGNERRCSGTGKVEMFDCGAAELLAFLPPSRLTHDGHYIQMSGIWGWTDRADEKGMGARRPPRRLDVRRHHESDSSPIAGCRSAAHRGRAPERVARDQGLQGPRLHRVRRRRPARHAGLRPDAPPHDEAAAERPAAEVEPDIIYREINSVHNIVINEDSGFAYAVGSSAGGTTCGGGLHMIDIRETEEAEVRRLLRGRADRPRRHGLLARRAVRDLQGPGQALQGPRDLHRLERERAQPRRRHRQERRPRRISRASYPNVAYTHQGWLTEDHRYFYLDDEGRRGRGHREEDAHAVWDFDRPREPEARQGALGVEAAVRPQPVHEGRSDLYQANYKSGLRILSIKDRDEPEGGRRTSTRRRTGR